MRIQRTRNAIKVSNICEMVHNKQTRNRTPFVFSYSGDGYYIYKGEVISEADFEDMFSIEMLPLIRKGKNKDGTKVWMQPSNL